MMREIVRIDEEKCDGCALCIPNCHEGALRIVNGKARLVADRLCDGLGACIGHCPRGAITIEVRECEAFDELAVADSTGILPSSSSDATAAAPTKTGKLPGPPGGSPGSRPETPCGCPSAGFAQWEGDDPPAVAQTPVASTPSALSHWPVQLRLLSPVAPVLHGSRWLVAADCVPVAYADFQQRLLRGRAVVIACPKLDDTRGYVAKLADMIRANRPEQIVVARMEVPCCGGILAAVIEARRHAGSDVPLTDVVVSICGEVLAQRAIPAEVIASTG